MTRASGWTVIVPTAGRAGALADLLGDLLAQQEQVEEILIADAMHVSDCSELCTDWLAAHPGLPLRHLAVPPAESGLPASRNYAVARSVSPRIAFLDDDTRLEPDYLRRLREPFDADDSIVGVGGYITNEVEWSPSGTFHERPTISPHGEYRLLDATRQLPSRWRWRARLGLASDELPGQWLDDGRVWPVSFWPPGDDWIDVDFVMGGASGWRRRVFEEYSFPSELPGYGHYEDLIFSLQVSRRARIVLHRGARLEHHHQPSARPSYRSYGRQVTYNGYCLWRQFRRRSGPGLTARFWLVELLNLAARLRGEGGLAEAVGRLQGAAAGLVSPVSFRTAPALGDGGHGDESLHDDRAMAPAG